MSKPSQSKESRLRSILKAISWRIVATLTTGTIAYFVTGNIEIAVTIGGTEVVLKIFLYYFHERAWQMMPMGTIRKLYRWKHGPELTE